jgi:hypothetical protein
MSEHYSHLLIPRDREFVPQPARVAAFLDWLIRLRSAPRDASVKVGKHLGKVRASKDFLTGEVLFTIPVREFAVLDGVGAIEAELQGLEDYRLSVAGIGPPERPLFPLYGVSDRKWRSEIRGESFYEVAFHLRAAGIALNEFRAEKPCGPLEMEGVFRNPWSNVEIKVPGADCARFWVEFMFGSWEVPKIEESFDLLPPGIVSLATDTFAMNFVQGGVFG